MVDRCFYERRAIFETTNLAVSHFVNFCSNTTIVVYIGAIIIIFLKVFFLRYFNEPQWCISADQDVLREAAIKKTH